MTDEENEADQEQVDEQVEKLGQDLMAILRPIAADRALNPTGLTATAMATAYLELAAYALKGARDVMTSKSAQADVGAVLSRVDELKAGSAWALKLSLELDDERRRASDLESLPSDDDPLTGGGTN